MHEGRLVEVAETEALFANPKHPCTRRLLAAMPGAWDGSDQARAERLCPGCGWL